ncbi:hypothetical protein PHYSODRAFT_299488 [Phytophthora sojae]|uniref:Uncharacterized protein n=1 Tax=Phytophthora sojae (strain P6497) TaxID=1094619 RepID=G4Z9E2_PHYSP|nr:hypothetical protein PHYSODRAFT_299488 [Phytophthora sojae]EGZ21943.1 hypothetical protein PHYSODRAFT_299488 [Phytophthora sojae]|eukprot:XP_009524660.1 hypothetical protein PHYSODRAFT_299488 [Phytophthora sojae]
MTVYQSSSSLHLAVSHSEFYCGPVIQELLRVTGMRLAFFLVLIVATLIVICEGFTSAEQPTELTAVATKLRGKHRPSDAADEERWVAHFWHKPSENSAPYVDVKRETTPLKYNTLFSVLAAGLVAGLAVAVPKIAKLISGSSD